MFSSPGMPKIYWTPSFSRHVTRSLAVVDSERADIVFSLLLLVYPPHAHSIVAEGKENSEPCLSWWCADDCCKEPDRGGCAEPCHYAPMAESLPLASGVATTEEGRQVSCH